LKDFAGLEPNDNKIISKQAGHDAFSRLVFDSAIRTGVQTW